MSNRASTLILVSTFLFPLISKAGGGWVGNSPMTVAAAPTTIYQPSYSYNEPEKKKWNSLLLPDGAYRLSGGLSRRFDDTESLRVSLSFDHAFSENWTAFNLTTWGYNLLPGNGKGHEVALFMGLMDGFGYSSFYGLFTGPGVGVGYAYSTNHWRISSKLSTSGMYSWSDSEWVSSKFKLGADLQYFISDKWSVGLESGARYYTFAKEDDCNFNACYRKSGDVVAEKTMLYVTRKITPKTEVSVGMSNKKDAFLGFSWNF